MKVTALIANHVEAVNNLLYVTGVVLTAPLSPPASPPRTSLR